MVALSGGEHIGALGAESWNGIPPHLCLYGSLLPLVPSSDVAWSDLRSDLGGWNRGKVLISKPVRSRRYLVPPAPGPDNLCPTQAGMRAAEVAPGAPTVAGAGGSPRLRSTLYWIDARELDQSHAISRGHPCPGPYGGGPSCPAAAPGGRRRGALCGPAITTTSRGSLRCSNR